MGGEYRVLDVFEGGMGSVYLVEHRELNSPIVLKTLLAANDRNAVQAFRREAETWLNIGFHPNIVRAHFFRIIDGLPFVAAEYIAPDVNGHNSVADYVGADNGPECSFAMVRPVLLRHDARVLAWCSCTP